MVKMAHVQQPQMVALAQRIGPIQFMQFLGGGPNGMDVCTVTHEYGLMRWLVALGPDGKIQRIAVTQVQGPWPWQWP
jgi:hypothetical protein